MTLMLLPAAKFVIHPMKGSEARELAAAALAQSDPKKSSP